MIRFCAGLCAALLLVACTQTIVVGSRESGAFVFEEVAGVWEAKQRLFPAVTDLVDQAGFSVAIHADVIAMGAPLEDSEAVGVLKAKKWLQKYEAPPMDEALDEALLDYIARREAEIPPT